ncbi:selenocysteine lyase, PLP-dependent [Legionella steigerwaltii]|uniref:Selenocysteine lyase, PLP-dependent n=1 Tax=Legionella steigerwaltii TaxID=460 RepID=A0A378L8B9_9GAMM|nr:aminotransferase class V-fold PLP-dependent enzyme [Legionella steigerwaltii]KTD77766.1 selenocysteine lyase, PLP-dependent [Legionella steigerwaltii]STY23076.1 selenocysteine lyase, PLP-dependent [Legionella steigerwaltii]
MEQLNIEQIRKETPGCKHVVHFNNAGAALSPLPVTQAIKNHLDLEAAIGGYEAAQQAANEIQQFYDRAAQLIHCHPKEIAFLENATRAWDMAFYSFRFNPGDKILTCVSEYASNYLAFLHQAKHTGVTIEVIQNDLSGQLDLEDLKRKIDKRVKLIAITHIPTQGGLINPAVEVGKIANTHNIPYLLDTTQSIGQLPIDVQEIGCDFLCATGRKFLRGPRGTGFLYASKRIIEHCDPPFIDLHSAQWISDHEYAIRPGAVRFETWEQNIAAKIGLGTAIKYALKLGLPLIWQRISQLAAVLRQNLRTIKSIKLHDLGTQQCGIVTFTSSEKNPQEIQQYLTSRRINVSISLQEYARLDMVKRNLPSLVRASIHYYNTETEIDTFCSELRKFLG